MKVLRIILTQKMASYKKEECDQNKMTYPLPPFSTVIGAVHKACLYTQYHPMDISISGNYGAMQKEVYRDYAFLNRTMDDRGILVKLANSDFLSTGFEKVASAKKQGSNFKTEIDIEIHNRELLDEYQELDNERINLADFKKSVLDPKLKELTASIKEVKDEQKTLDKKSDEYIILKEKITLLTEEKELLKGEYDARKSLRDEKYSKFATLTTSMKFYEVLYDVNLVIHIKSDDDTLNDIYSNIENLVSIGRSEDFVDVSSCEYVDCSEELDEVFCNNSAYVKLENVRNEYVFGKIEEEKYASGTLYYLNKNYEIINGKRIFKKEKVVYLSQFFSDSYNGSTTGLYVDNDGYVINFI